MDVDYKELYQVVILFVEFFHVLNLSTERGLRVTAKYEGDRFLAFEVGQLYSFFGTHAF